MVSELTGSETVLTGLLEDQSALFGVVGQIEALGLELLELRQIRARPTPRDDPHPMACEAKRTSPNRKTSAHDNRNCC
jgi:hypothetical protein